MTAVRIFKTRFNDFCKSIENECHSSGIEDDKITTPIPHRGVLSRHWSYSDQCMKQKVILVPGFTDTCAKQRGKQCHRLCNAQTMYRIQHKECRHVSVQWLFKFIGIVLIIINLCFRTLTVYQSYNI